MNDMKTLYEAIARQLEEKFIQPKAFTDPFLSVQEVAKIAGTNAKYLSQYIKEVKGCNFSQFINDLRINYSAELLLSDRTKTIQEVSYSAGFNSQSSFLNYFRSTFHLTPSLYRQTNGEGYDEMKNEDKNQFHDFENRLLTEYPNLSERDVQLCTLLLEPLTADEIAERLGITYGSLLVTRCRLREKMGLNRTDHLELILQNLLS